MSDDELDVTKDPGLQQTSSKSISALDSLLAGGQKSETKREPTLLEQMISGKSISRKKSLGNLAPCTYSGTSVKFRFYATMP